MHMLLRRPQTACKQQLSEVAQASLHTNRTIMTQVVEIHVLAAATKLLLIKQERSNSGLLRCAETPPLGNAKMIPA